MLGDAIQYLIDIRNNPNDLIVEVIKDYEDVVLDENVKVLNTGEYMDGTNVAPPYTPLTVKIKKAKGQTYDRVTWKDKGKLHKNLSITYRQDDCEIIANVSQYKRLVQKYGERLGMNDYLIDFLCVKVIERIRHDFKKMLLK